MPAWQAPTRARPRAFGSHGSATATGRDAHRVRAASRASGSVNGLAPAAHNASRQWARAFIPLAAVMGAGRR
jgi:hypothetical protein